jgi:hypothetical protein
MKKFLLLLTLFLLKNEIAESSKSLLKETAMLKEQKNRGWSERY